MCSRHFFETRMSQEVSLEPLGDEWAGYKAIVTGGNDKQGFPMKQVSRDLLDMDGGHEMLTLWRES